MKNNTKTLDKLIEENYGKIGSRKRDEFEKGFIDFKIGYIKQNMI